MSGEHGHLGNYELVRRLGKGGMAETFVAIRRGPQSFEQSVCLKRVLPHLTQDARFTQLFLDEARLIARMRHSHIVQVYDFGSVGATHYLALELIEGTDLRGLLRYANDFGFRIHPDLITLIVFDVASALAYAHGLNLDEHNAGIVHRDVSPANILLSRAGEVKLTDFGVAKAPQSDYQTSTGEVKGKIPYLAPEQALGQRVDGRTDLFALGVVLYEALAGSRPFDGPTDAATLVKVTQGRYIPIEKLVPKADPQLHAIVRRLLAVEPVDRFANASELQQALEPLVPPPMTRRRLGDLVAQCSLLPRAAPSRPISGLLLQDNPDNLPASEHDPSPQSQPTPHNQSAPPNRPTPHGQPSPVDRAAPPQDLVATVTRLPEASAADSAVRVGPTNRTATNRTGTVVGVGIAATIAAGALGAALFARQPSTTTHKRDAQSQTIHRRPQQQPRPQPPRQHAHRQDAQQPSTESLPAAATTSAATTAGDSPPTTAGSPLRTRDATAPAAVSVRTRNGTTAEATPTAKTRTAQRNRRRESKAQLTVLALPWGKVWLNGRLLGSAPQTVWLKSGRHRVQVGLDEPSTSTTVKLAAGETRRIVLRPPRK